LNKKTGGRNPERTGGKGSKDGLAWQKRGWKKKPKAETTFVEGGTETKTEGDHRKLKDQERGRNQRWEIADQITKGKKISSWLMSQRQKGGRELDPGLRIKKGEKTIMGSIIGSP